VVGVAVAHTVPNVTVAAGIAVAASILAMALTGSLHPPGGSTALLAVLGGPAVQAAGYSYALVPVGLNAILLVATGMVYHSWVSGHAYPHGLPRPTQMAEPPGFDLRPEDIDAAVRRYGEVLDIERADVEVLIREVEKASLKRRQSANPPA
jgi:CBS domain-containing membrane protein